MAGRFCKRGIIITKTIHSISGYTFLYSVYMQLYVYSLRCCSNFLPVMLFLKCLISHSFSFSSGFIKWVISTNSFWQVYFLIISVCVMTVFWLFNDQFRNGILLDVVFMRRWVIIAGQLSCRKWNLCSDKHSLIGWDTYLLVAGCYLFCDINPFGHNV